jgi:uncharacterized protein (TIGR02246 family)
VGTAMLEREMAATDEAAVRALYYRLMEGWNQGTAGAFAESMDDEVDFVPFDGVPIKGREAVAVFHEPLFRTYLKGTRLVGEVTRIRFLSPTVALMHARGGTILRGKSSPSPARDSIQTMVAVKADRGWLLIAFQNTRIRPIGKNFAGSMWWLVTDWIWKFVRPRGKRAT